MNESLFRVVRSYSIPTLFCGVLCMSVCAPIFVDTSGVVTYVELHPMYGALIFGVLMCTATVIAPVTLLPAVPMVAPLIGPLHTALSCTLGWTCGATIAFLIARYGGRPLIRRFVTLATLDRYGSMVPKEAHLPLIIALRMCIPVDVLSYALGLFSNVSLSVYVLGTVIGVLWFSFAFSYLGYAFFHGMTVHLLLYGVASGTVFLGALLYTRHVLRKNRRT